MNKRFMLCLMEIITFCILMMCAVERGSERFTEVNLWALFLVPVIAFILVNVSQYILEVPLKKMLCIRRGGIIHVITCILIAAMFCSAFRMLSILGNMPCSVRTFMLAGLCTTVMHFIANAYFGLMFNTRAVEMDK